MTTTREGEAFNVANGVPYFEMEDGMGMKHRIVDTDRYDLPHSGQLVFECTKRGERVIENSYQVGMTVDSNSGVMFGIPTGIDRNSKQIKWMPIPVRNLMVYDLSIPNDRKKAIMLQRSNICEGSPNLTTNIKLHVLRLHDSDKAAQNDIKRVMDGQRALSIAAGLHGEELINTARNLGIMPETTSITVLTAEVLKAAEKRPSDFLAIWENPNREKITILKRCLDTGVMTHDAFAGYTYLGRPLGHSEPDVIEYLIKYPDIATTLDMKSRDKLSQSVKAMTKAPAINKTDLESEVAILRKQLADRDEQLKDLTATAIRSDEPGLLEEFEALKKEAKDLQITPLHVYKPTRESMDKLKVKIDAAKQPA